MNWDNANGGGVWSRWRPVSSVVKERRELARVLDVTKLPVVELTIMTGYLLMHIIHMLSLILFLCKIEFH